MATEKRRRIVVPTTEQRAPQLPPLPELRALLERMERLEAENAQLRAARTGPLTEEELTIGKHVAARVGAKDYVPAEVVDIYTSATGQGTLYALRRLDDGTKGLNPKPASHLFPPERVNV